jgi:hypothetical protein
MKDFTLTELKCAAPFPQVRNGETEWIAPAYYMTDGRVGGYIFRTEEDAKKELVLMIARLENKIKWEAEEAEKKRKEVEADKALILSYNGFLSDNAMKAGKQRLTLEKTSWFGKVCRMVTKKEFVEIVLSEGYSPAIRQKMKGDGRGYLIKEGDKTEYILNKDDSSYVVNKTEYDYAVFLTENK